MKTVPEIEKDAKRLFWQKGPCSSAFFHLLNREFGHPQEIEERAAEPLCGGLMLRGKQCGLLWGAALGVGAEAYRRYKDREQAIAVAMTATQRLMESFTKTANSVDCRDITRLNFTNPFHLGLFMAKAFLQLFSESIGITVKGTCFNIAGKWGPEVIRTAKAGLAEKPKPFSQPLLNCACEVARKMGASDEETMTVAGFAGGMGLSGKACGALAAAVWINTLAWARENPGKSLYPNPYAKKTLDAFLNETQSEFLCHKIAGQRFKTLDQHTEFIKSGGCEKLIKRLAGKPHPAGRSA